MYCFSYSSLYHVLILMFIRESVYDIHPTLWKDMQRDIMKTVLMHKDRDSELKRTQKVPATPTATAPVEACGSSYGWQPPPHMWPSTVQNPLSVWGGGSMEPGWVQQQVPQQQQFSQHQQQPQQFFQPQQQRSFSRQQQQQDKQHDAPTLSQLTPWSLHLSKSRVRTPASPLGSARF